MAVLKVPVMRAKVDPNPRGSATAHVTMPSANPFEREAVSVRLANQPQEMMPGMGEFKFDFSGGGSTSGGELLPAAKSPDASSGWDWGGLLKNVTGAAIEVGQQAAIHELTKPEDKSAQTSTTQMLQALAAQNLQKQQAAGMSKPAIQTLPVTYPAPSSGMSKSMPWIIGIAAVTVVGGGLLLMSRKGGGKRRRRSRRRR